jgi:hypothetical protein
LGKDVVAETKGTRVVVAISIRVVHTVLALLLLLIIYRKNGKFLR